MVLMQICPKCTAKLPDNNRFCPACGAAQPAATILASDLPQDLASTAPMERRATPSASTAPLTPAGSSTSVTGLAGGGGRFIPGAMVTDRYRIVGLLGRGGMGEVYRADDLKLGQPVALKFLPPGLEQNPARLERFLNEVRTALKVTHPNVCRVYDIGEVDGQHFLSMEYVDGEDLASLLTRIGRLPHERAVQVSRQICAGLAAAHDQGILHRDLKPANVMIDGRGQVRLTDFGLAGLADAIGQDDVTSGTPGYMAPEQLAGQEVTKRSDIYSLGLVLYEIFTGRAVFSGQTVAELTQLHTNSQPSSPSSHVDGIDPAVERTVLHCLEKNPADRPGSVLGVSAALPGGDPLAAALAAGETPSPELVAEAGSREGMNPGRALLLAMVAFVTLAGAAWWAGTLTITNFLPLEKRPEVLVDRAQSILEELGYQEPIYSDPVDQTWGMLQWSGIFAEIAPDSSSRRWEKLRERPDAAAFWYRQSPQLLRPDPNYPPIFTRGVVQLMNPDPTIPGEAMVLLDLDGNLRRFEVLPKRFSTREPSEPDWDPLFAMANLDPTRFTEDRPRYQRFMSPDVRRAWIGSRAHAPDVELRVEAGAFEGRPVLFNVATSTSLEALGQDPESQRWGIGEFLNETLQPVLILLVAVAAIILSRRNIHQGRSDRRGAARFGTTAFFLFVVANALRSHLMGTVAWAEDIWPIFVGATFVSVIAWSLYSASEPLVRRVWPTMFVSSSRLLSRPKVQWLDPVIGKAVLVGIFAAGIRLLLEVPLRWWIRYWITGEAPRPLGINLQNLQGQRETLASIFDLALLFGFVLIFVMALILIRMKVKRRVPALLITFVVWVLLNGPDSLSFLPFTMIQVAISMVVLLRWGVLAYFVSLMMISVGYDARAADWSAWHSQGPALAMGFIVLLTIYGAWAAIGGKRGDGSAT
jgi:serine/threonine-protein kinase